MVALWDVAPMWQPLAAEQPQVGGAVRSSDLDLGLLKPLGTPVRSVVRRTNEDAAPGMYPIRDVREMLGHLSSVKLISRWILIM